jgi:hypothetical protein
MTDMMRRAMFVEYYWLLFLVNWCSHGLGFIVSILVKPHVAQLAAVVVVFLFNIFSGCKSYNCIMCSNTVAVLFLPDIDKMIPPINYVPWVTYLMYGLQGLYITELRYFEKIYDLSKTLDIYGFKLDRLPLLAGLLVANGMVFRITAWFLLNASKPGSYVYRISSSLTNYKHHFGKLKAKLTKQKVLVVKNVA